MSKQFSIRYWIAKNFLGIKTNNSNSNRLNRNEFEDIYIFDFKNFESKYNRMDFDSEGDVTLPSIDNVEPLMSEGQSKSYPTKIKIKPIDVLTELETIPTPFSLNYIDEKLSVLRDKQKLIVQQYAKREVTALIERLENRKKYEKFRTYFEQFQNTNEESIDKLLSKYALVMETSDLFVPEFPNDAIETMKSYTEQCMMLCDKKPIFYVIAEESKFRKAYEKRDPILLVQSPFGFYWQILGAWDAEMLILHEL